jgi:uncharacterized membrane protein
MLMTFCPNCGASVEGRFCAKCGAAVGAPAASTPAGMGAGSGPVISGAGMTDNVAGALAYVLGFITGILFLVLEPYSRNRNVRFHAFQSIFLSVGLIILQFVISSLSVISLGLSVMLGLLLSLASLLIWLFMLWKTYQGEKVVLPVIGPIAEKQA